MKTNSADERRSARANVVLAGVIENGVARIRVRVANMSAYGVLVIGDEFPGEETQVTFRCNGLAVESWMAWVRAPYAGIQFDEPVEPAGLLRNMPVRHQLIVRDTRTVNFRRPGFRGNQLTDAEWKVVEEWARPRRTCGAD